MKQDASFPAALWFIPLVAICLAILFTLIVLIGWKLYKEVSVPAVAVAPQSVAAVVPFVEQEEPNEQPSLPPEVTQQESPSAPADETAEPEVCPPTAVPSKIKKPRRSKSAASEPYALRLRRCVRGGIFPCAWEDNSHGVIKQYWLMDEQGPVQRGIYDRAGHLISETTATLSGTVTSHTEQDITYYFEAGMLVKIRTSPYANCNFHDWFFINEGGRLDVCQCALSQASCCERSPYQQGGPRTYCGLFPLDEDFCRN